MQNARVLNQEILINHELNHPCGLGRFGGGLGWFGGGLGWFGGGSGWFGGGLGLFGVL